MSVLFSVAQGGGEGVLHQDGTGHRAHAAVAPKASYITPVPGGVGPVTRAVLMEKDRKSVV